MDKEGGQTMRIFLVQCGEARGKLTKFGRKQMRAAADFLGEFDPEIDPEFSVIATSYERRGAESGAIIRSELEIRFVARLECLNSDLDGNQAQCLVRSLYDDLKKINPRLRDCVVVCHELQLLDVLESATGPCDANAERIAESALGGDVFLVRLGENGFSSPRKVFNTKELLR